MRGKERERERAEESAQFYLGSEWRRDVEFVLSSSIFIDLTRQNNQDEILFHRGRNRMEETERPILDQPLTPHL